MTHTGIIISIDTHANKFLFQVANRSGEASGEGQGLVERWRGGTRQGNAPYRAAARLIRWFFSKYWGALRWPRVARTHIGMWPGARYSAARHGCYGFAEAGWEVAEEDVRSDDFLTALAYVHGNSGAGDGDSVEGRVTPTEAAAALRRVAARGHPRGLRPLAWAFHLALDGMDEFGGASGGDAASTGEATEATLRDIAKDVGRTFPTHPWIASNAGAAALSRLLASASTGPAGYTQGLNFLGGWLLLVLDAGKAAQALKRICGTLGYWTPDAKEGLVGLAVDQVVLGTLVSEVQDVVASHLRHVAGLDLGLMGVRWLLTLFTTSLPPMCVLRLWDLLFSRWGDDPRPVLFGAALTLIDRNTDTLLATRDAGEALAALNALGRDLHCTDVDDFIRATDLLALKHATRVRHLRRRVLSARSWQAWWPDTASRLAPSLP